VLPVSQGGVTSETHVTAVQEEVDGSSLNHVPLTPLRSSRSSEDLISEIDLALGTPREESSADITAYNPVQHDDNGEEEGKEESDIDRQDESSPDSSPRIPREEILCTSYASQADMATSSAIVVTPEIVDLVECPTDESSKGEGVSLLNGDESVSSMHKEAYESVIEREKACEETLGRRPEEQS
jgi:hypothetical protein